jgi:hypothetical protein
MNMLYRVLILVLALAALGFLWPGFLWPGKLRLGLRVAGLVAVAAAIGLLAVVLLNLPKAPY